jgi:ribosomal protein S18 acetylase RimI-like enzyme
MARVVGRSPVAFIRAVALACLRRPSFVLDSVQLMTRLSRERTTAGPAAELVSLGILPRALRAIATDTGRPVSPAAVLLAASMSKMRELGTDSFRLYTDASNRLACAFYRRLGFHEDHRFEMFGQQKICFTRSTYIALPDL